MAYLVDTSNGPDLELRERVRPAHLDYLAQNMPLLIAAGAKLSDDGKTPTGSFYILDVDDVESAEAFMSAEPYSASGVVDTITYSRWRRAIFNHQRVTPA